MKWLSLIKSSFHDPRCCDEGVVTVPVDAPLLWRALPGSVTCLLGSDGFNTGVAHVGTLEQFNSSTGVATGLTKPNLSSDPNFINDYISLLTCALHNDVPTTGVLYAFNGNTGILVIHLEGLAGAPNYDFDCPPAGNITMPVHTGSYDVSMHVFQNAPLHVQMICNLVTVVVASDVNEGFPGSATPINISTRPQTFP